MAREPAPVHMSVILTNFLIHPLDTHATMGKSDLSGTPKATITLKNLGGKEFSAKDATFAGIATLKFTRGPVLASLQVSEKTPSGFQVSWYPSSTHPLTSVFQFCSH